MPLEEALLVAGKFLESTANGLLRRGVKLDHNDDVFRLLCTKQMVLEKLRCDLITRNLCPISLHSLCSVFAMAYWCVMMRAYV